MYGKINGKQIKDLSVDLIKLDISGSQGGYLLGTGSYFGTYEVPNIPQAYITKQYADSISAGLDPKESVYLVAVTNVATSGTVSIDGYTASLGSRVLLTNQTSAIDNGIFVVSATAWSRAADSDGNPSGEVSLGNYTFVERGLTFGTSGWVLYDTDATGATVSPGVNTQLWTQFNGAGTFIWGDGLANIGNNIYVDIAPAGGLTFSGTQLKVADYIAGPGLTIAGGVLSVGPGTGISVAADTVGITDTGVAAGSYGSPNSVATFVVNAQGQLTTAGTASISIVTQQITNFTASVQSLASTVAGGTGINVASVGGYATVSIANTGVLAGSYGNVDSINTFNVNAQGQLTSVGTSSISIVTQQITNFTASVQSLASTVTGGTGITVSTSGGNATVSIANTGVVAGSYGAANSVNTFVVNAQGQLTAAGTASISIVTGQITNFTASVQSSIVAGNGLTSSGGVIDILVVKGVTFSGDYLFADASTILTTAGLTSVGIATNSTIQQALTAIDNALVGIGNQQEIAINNNPTGTFLKTINAPFNMLGYTFSLASDGAPHVYINGVYVKTTSPTASSAAYFSTDGGITGTTSVAANSALYLNAFVLGFKVDPTDDVVVHYLTKYP